MGGVSGGGYLVLTTANGHVELDITCNYGAPGDNSAYFFANDPVVTTGTAQVMVAISGRPLLASNDLNYNSGGQDRAFADTSFQGTWPWHGLFTVNEAGVLTRCDVTVTGASGAEYHAYVFAIGNGTADIRHP